MYWVSTVLVCAIGCANMLESQNVLETDKVSKRVSTQTQYVHYVVILPGYLGNFIWVVPVVRKATCRSHTRSDATEAQLVTTSSGLQWTCVLPLLCCSNAQKLLLHCPDLSERSRARLSLQGRLKHWCSFSPKPALHPLEPCPPALLWSFRRSLDVFHVWEAFSCDKSDNHTISVTQTTTRYACSITMFSETQKCKIQPQQTDRWQANRCNLHKCCM